MMWKQKFMQNLVVVHHMLQNLFPVVSRENSQWRGVLGVPDDFSDTSHIAVCVDDVLHDDVRCLHHFTIETALSLHTTQRSAGQYSRYGATGECIEDGRGLVSFW